MSFLDGFEGVGTALPGRSLGPFADFLGVEIAIRRDALMADHKVVVTALLSNLELLCYGGKEFVVDAVCRSVDQAYDKLLDQIIEDCGWRLDEEGTLLG